MIYYFDRNRPNTVAASVFTMFGGPKRDKIHSLLQIEERLIRSQIGQKERTRISTIQLLTGKFGRGEIADVSTFATLTAVDLAVAGGQEYSTHVGTLLQSCDALCNKKIPLSPDVQASLDFCWAVAQRNKQKEMENTLKKIEKVHKRAANIDPPRSILFYLGLAQPTPEEICEYAWRSFDGLGLSQEYLDLVFKDPAYASVWKTVVIKHSADMNSTVYPTAPGGDIGAGTSYPTPPPPVGDIGTGPSYPTPPPPVFPTPGTGGMPTGFTPPPADVPGPGMPPLVYPTIGELPSDLFESVVPEQQKDEDN